VHISAGSKTMPLYEFECEACSHRFEVIQKFSDPPPEKCPVCCGHVKKLLSSPAIQFKGSGFYLTDYGRTGSDASTGGDPKKGGDSKSAESKSGGESKSAAETKSGGESKSGGDAKTSESKPAAAPESSKKTDKKE
jgi:putative FmdB family regulatory protein